MDDNTLEHGVPSENRSNGIYPEEERQPERDEVGQEIEEERQPEWDKVGPEIEDDSNTAQNVDNQQNANETDEEDTVRRKKTVPLWRLFQYANCCDIMMIIIGTMLALAAGLALPAHIILIGGVLNVFIDHSIVTINNLQFSSNVSCENSLSPSLLANLTSTTKISFCSMDSTTGGSGRLEFVCNPDGTLWAKMGLFSVYYVAIGTGMFIAVYLSMLFWKLSALKQVRKMRKALYHSILHQDISWFDTVDAGDISTRLIDDIENVQSGIGEKVASLIQQSATFVASFVIGFVFYWKLALVMYITIPILSGMITLLAKVITTFTQREQEAYGLAGGIAEEVLSSIRTVVAFGGEKNETKRYGEKLKLTRKVSVKKHLLSELIEAALHFVIFSTYGLAVWYGSILIVNCEILSGDVIIVMLSAINGSLALGNALPDLGALAAAVGSATLVFEIIDREQEIDSTSDEGEAPDHLDGNIEFSDVIFAYPTRPDIKILKGLDLKIKAGDTVALVGPSGCGKSTIIQLIQRFYNPIAGLVTIDGREISAYNLQWLRRHIGIVSQEPILFNSSIADNIRFGRDDATMEDIVQAAKNANAHFFISQLPDGYDTLVGQRGSQLSGGQKQRIAIARALVRNPKILILDEATSALDNQSERIVQKALDKARQGRTTIAIAHRLSTIQNADVIVAISEGHIVEFGCHVDLMKKGGLYHELVMAQTIEEEEERNSNKPLDRFRAVVNKSIEARRHILDTFRAAVRESVAASKKRAPHRLSQRKRTTSGSNGPSRKPTLSRQMSRQLSQRSSQMSLQLGSAGVFSVSTGSTYFNGNPEYAEDEKGQAEMVETQSYPSFMELLKLNKPDWIFVFVGVIFSVLYGCMFPAMSVLIGRTVAVYGLTDPDLLKTRISEVAGGFVALGLSAFVFIFFGNFSLDMAGERLTKRLRYQSFKSMLSQEIAWFDKKTNSTGALLARLATDASSVKQVTGVFIGKVLQAICTLIAALVVAFISSWELALVLMFAFPLHALATYFQIRFLTARAIKNKRRIEECSQTALESIDNIRTVASLGLEPYFCTKYSSLLKGLFSNDVKSLLVEAIIPGFGRSFQFFIYSVCCALGTYLIIENRRDYVNIVRVLTLLYFSTIMIAQVFGVGPQISKAKVSAFRILSLLKRKPQIDAMEQSGLKLDKVEGNISANSVHFSYPTRPTVEVLQGLSIDVKSGQTLALVGPSGCGKSTIVSLVERFYDPKAGKVVLEGSDLKELNLSWLRRQIGIVPQEPTLFAISIADNIRYGALHRDVTDEEVVEAAKSANIHKFIESLPKGYATNIGSKGTQLSGGQKQRIAIARALIRNPKILLLDEATSALDTESEKVVQEALDKAREGRTSIVIAHRLSTIYNSDVIAVIHEGQVIESGTHAELMGMKEAYYHLNTVQQNE